MKPKLHLDWIDSDALKIVATLQKQGFEAYLVGGCVRDLLAGIHPKDFDIATSAKPEQVRKYIYNSYVIGRRFRLVLVKRGELQFEVSTFRRNGTEEETNSSSELITPQGDNFFGSVEEDAARRDFTVNALFFDPIKNEMLDYCQGLNDIKGRVIKMIGHPVERLIEDPIRILRAVRLAHKLHFSLDPDLRMAIVKSATELKKSVLPRRREEFLKLLRLDHPERALIELFDLGVLNEIAPRLHEAIKDTEKREVFFGCLSRLSLAGIQMSSPQDLFAAFVYSLISSYHETTGKDFETLFSSKEITELMRDELGLFKMETVVLARSIEFIPRLRDHEAYLRKGQRRQQAFLSNEALPLSLKIAQLDYALSGSDLHFWMREQRRFVLTKSL